MPADKKGEAKPELEAELDEEALQKGITASKGRPTPSRRKQEEEAEQPQGNFIVRTVNNLREYFEGVRGELQKVTWPTRAEARRLTIIVLVALIISSIVLGAISGVFTEMFRVGLGSPLLLVGFMVLAVIAGFVLARLTRTENIRY
jgi:preprotein translocase subunit SecE